MPKHAAMKCVVGLLAVAALGACAPKEVPIVEHQGECADVFQSKVCTWARMRGDSVVDAGAMVPLAMVENAPKEMVMAWPPVASASLALPEAVQQRTGLRHLTVYWEWMGHPPGPYLTPHFDFHFYTISREERTAMDCADLSKPAELPSGYSLPDVALPPPMAALTGVSTLVGLCVPQMGMHSLLTTELESTETFRGTMVVGFYKGKAIFVEPMITQAMLQEQHPFTLPIPSIPGMVGNYPHSFRAEYDEAQKAYRFVFADFSGS